MLKLAYFLTKIQTSRVNNSRILRIKNAKFSGFYIYMNQEFICHDLNPYRPVLF